MSFFCCARFPSGAAPILRHRCTHATMQLHHVHAQCHHPWRMGSGEVATVHKRDPYRVLSLTMPSAFHPPDMTGNVRILSHPEIAPKPASKNSRPNMYRKTTTANTHEHHTSNATPARHQTKQNTLLFFFACCLSYPPAWSGGNHARFGNVRNP